jgi:hypothetical protein
MADGLTVGPVVDDVTVVLNPDDPLVTETDIIQLVETWDLTDDVVDVVMLDTDGLPHDGIGRAEVQPSGATVPTGPCRSGGGRVVTPPGAAPAARRGRSLRPRLAR